MIKVNDIVWVNEATLAGKPLKHEWYGRVMKIEGDTVTVKDTGKNYHGEVFTRMISNLETKEH